jgi:hypothetical protein
VNARSTASRDTPGSGAAAAGPRSTRSCVIDNERLSHELQKRTRELNEALEQQAAQGAALALGVNPSTLRGGMRKLEIRKSG